MRLIFLYFILFFLATPRVRLRWRKYDEALLFFCRRYIMKNVSLDQQLILVKFFLSFSLLHILTVSNLQTCDSSRVETSPRRLSSPCCCIYRVPYLALWNDDHDESCRLEALRQFMTLFVLTLARWCDINCFLPLEDVWLQKSPELSLSSFFFFVCLFGLVFFHAISVSQGPMLLPTGPELILV